MFNFIREVIEITIHPVRWWKHLQFEMKEIREREKQMDARIEKMLREKKE